MLHTTYFLITISICVDTRIACRTHALVEATRRIEGHVCNVMTENLPVEAESMHFVLCMFVLSALPPKVPPTYLPTYLPIYPPTYLPTLSSTERYLDCMSSRLYILHMQI